MRINAVKMYGLGRSMMATTRRHWSQNRNQHVRCLQNAAQQQESKTQGDIGVLMPLGLVVSAISFGRYYTTTLGNDNDSSQTYFSATACEKRQQQQEQGKICDGLSKTTTTTTKDLKQVSNNLLRTCGEWCANVDKSTPCRMDSSKIQCQGKYCDTTAGLWSLFMLGPHSKKRRVSCDLYKAGLAYPIGACPCDASCLIPEVRKDRYPEPTGLGVFCTPGTCRPGARPNPTPNKGLGTLQCPCNWFGSECTDDWIPIRRIEKTSVGHLDHLRLTLLDEDDNDRHDHHNGSNPSSTSTSVASSGTIMWKKFIKDYRPGAVARFNFKNGDTMHELSCVVSRVHSATKQVELILSPPDSSLHPSVRYIADLLRSQQQKQQDSNKVERQCAVIPAEITTKLHVNPLISGFYNSRYQYLQDYIKQHNVKTVIIVATGCGLAGAVSVLDSVLGVDGEDGGYNNDDPAPANAPAVHLFYGLHNARHLPYADQLAAWIKSGKLDVSLIESRRGERRPSKHELPIKLGQRPARMSSNESSNRGQDHNNSYSRDIIQHEEIRAAAEKGYDIQDKFVKRHNSTKTAASTTTTTPDGKGRKFYAQNALECNLRNGKLGDPSRVAVVVCGRLSMMDETRSILEQHGVNVEEQLFLNI